MRFAFLVAAALATALSLPPAADAQPAEPAPPRPALLVVISIDQLSADLFAQYRRHFTGGLARMLEGAVFPSGYQAHAATETCPGHSTILTGAFPSRTGIIANDWRDLEAARDDKRIYCMEDERVPGSTNEDYTVSPVHLLVPTLGDLLEQADESTRTVSVGGKDRSAVLLGGHDPDHVFWPGETGFTTYEGAELPAALAPINASIAAQLAAPRAADPLPALCGRVNRPIAVGDAGRTEGTGLFAREAGDRRGFMASPDADKATLDFALALANEYDLGRSGGGDLLTVGLSATDYVGHYDGTGGTEMCAQLLALDAMLGEFFAALDARGVPYAVALTADHGGIDLPERQRLQAAPDAARVDPDLGLTGAVIGETMEIEQALIGGPFGDIYVNDGIGEAERAEVLRRAVERFSAHPQVAAVFTHAQLAATPIPQGPPESWTLIERARASFHPERSGDLVVLPAPRVSLIADPGERGAVATHGSPWDYDRRVPILFWQRDRPGFEQPLGVLTADIMPTLAALIGFDISGREIDGRCLDLDPGEATTCPD